MLFALAREAWPYRRRATVPVLVSGVGPAASRAALDGLREPPAFVVSAGFCGALDPSLAVGDVIVSDGRDGRIHTSEHLVGDPAEKARLFAATGARVVDMETATVAAWCDERGIPFRAVRSVSDVAAARLSPKLLALLAGGRVSWWRLPGAGMILPELLRLARDTHMARQTLAAAVARDVAVLTP